MHPTMLKAFRNKEINDARNSKLKLKTWNEKKKRIKKSNNDGRIHGSNKRKTRPTSMYNIRATANHCRVIAFPVVNNLKKEMIKLELIKY